MTLGNRVKQRLEELGESQEWLARKCGVSQAAIFKVISGKTKNPRFIDELSYALQKPIPWLKRGTGDGNLITASSKSGEQKKTPVQEVIDWLNTYERMSAEARRMADAAWEEKLQGKRPIVRDHSGTKEKKTSS